MSVTVQPRQEAVERAIDDLQLRPEIRARLDACLSTYAELMGDFKLLEEQIGVEKSKIGKILADHGYDKVKTDEFALTWVRGSTTSSLDKTKLVAQGVTLAQIEAATVTKPRKDYFQIRGKTEKVD